MQNLINYLSTVDFSHLGAVIGSFLAAGGGLAGVIQFLKRLRNWDNAAFIQLMVATFGLVAAAADVIIRHSNSNDPLALLFGHVWPTLLVAATIMHRVAINPLTKLIENSIGSTIKDAKAYRAEKQPPVTEPPVVTDQFN